MESFISRGGLVYGVDSTIGIYFVFRMDSLIGAGKFKTI